MWRYETIICQFAGWKCSFQTIRKSFRKYFIFFRNFLVFKNQKISILNSWILNRVSKHKAAINFKFKHFSRKIVKILNFFFLNPQTFLKTFFYTIFIMSIDIFFFFFNILIIFHWNTVFLKTYWKLFPNVFKISQLFL